MKYFFNCGKRVSGQRQSAYVLDDHDQEGKLDGEGLLGVNRASNVVGAHVGAHDFKNGGLNVGVRDSLDVTIAHVLVPNLEGLGTSSKVSKIG